jgi:hypothetical protein
MTAYLTLVEYTAYGGTLTDPAFSRLEFQARSLVNQFTLGRLKEDTTFPEAVKRAMFELIGMIANADITADGYTGAITQESNDGYSISFAADSAVTVQKISDLAEGIILRYLTGEKNAAGELLLSRWV